MHGNVGAARKLRKDIKVQLERKKDVRPESNEFVQRAKNFVEILLPSKMLKPGLCVYDILSFSGSDARILSEDLLKLVDTIHLIIVYLYDNLTESDDTRKCSAELQVVLPRQDIDVGILFRNRKARTAVMRKDVENDDGN